MLDKTEEGPNSLTGRVITEMTAHNMMYGGLPSASNLKEKFKLNLADFKLVLEEVDEPIDNRFGISPKEYYAGEFLSPVEKVMSRNKREKELPGVSDGLDPFFLLACNVICQSTDKRSTAAKLRAMNVSTAKWEGFMRDAKMRKYFEEILHQTFDRAESGAKLALIRNIESGDLQSIKHYQEYTGRFKPNSEVTMNLGLIIGKMMEILVRFLTPEQMVQVADEIEGVIAPPKELTA